MTKKKDLKKRVRARQEKTGESYTTALAQVLPKASPRVQIVEAPSATAEAREAGLRCDAVVTPGLLAMGDLRPLFVRLRELFEALEAEACGPLLRGEEAPLRIPGRSDSAEARRFLAAAREGQRGLSRDGRLASFAWRGQAVFVYLLIYGGRMPLLQLGLLSEAKAWPHDFVGVGR